MTEGIFQEPPREHLDDPIHISEAVDAVVNQLATRESLERGMDWLLDRQKELYEEHQQLRLQGKGLASEQETELDEIHDVMLTMQDLLKKYHPDTK